jgi:hypothetical protein
MRGALNGRVGSSDKWHGVKLLGNGDMGDHRAPGIVCSRGGPLFVPVNTCAYECT